MASGGETGALAEMIGNGGRCIVLSPHLDDGALSCGGFLAAMSESHEVEVWTFFASAPAFGPYSQLAKWFHQISGGSSGAWLAWKRRREDTRACKILGARPRHFRWHDAVYRIRQDGTPTYQQSRQPTWDSADEALINAITAKLQSTLLPRDVVLAPLGVGSHVDHLILRSAIQRSGHADVLYYPDIPYIESFGEELKSHVTAMRCIEYEVSGSNLKTWIDSVMQYATQIRMLEDAVGSLPALIRRLATDQVLCFYA